MNNPFFRDYTFPEWTRLSPEDQRTIRNQFWSPFPPHHGRKTRDAIVEAFLAEHPEFKTAPAVGIGWFGWYIEALFVVVEDQSTRVPQKFAGVLVNKGVLRQKESPDKWIVDWRDAGGTNSPFDPKKEDCQPEGPGYGSQARRT